MKIQAASVGILALFACLGLVVAQDRPAGQPEPTATGKQPAAAPEREADTKALSDLLASFVKTYNAKDAKALGDLFMPDAEVEDEDGEVVRGRDAIIKQFAQTIEDNRGETLSVEPDSLRFLGADLAIEEGTASLSSGADTPPRTNRYSVIYARQGGRWLHARIRDEPEEDVDVPAHERLRELEWMLGEWVNESDDEVVLTTCKWSDDGNFLLRNFDVKIEGRVALRGTQRIGWDPQQRRFRMWVFDDSGGFAEGLLARDDDGWVIKGTGVRADGQSVSFTTVVTQLDKDRLRWQILDRSVGGTAASDADQFELVRRPPAPGK